MVLPLYFAIFSEEIDKFRKNSHPIAAMGYTFRPSGGQFTRPRSLPADLLVVDDRVIPSTGTPDSYVQALLTGLKAIGASGVMFDFERPNNPFCMDFLKHFSDQAPHTLQQIVPPDYAAACPSALVLVSGTPCNSWRHFCTAQQARYGNRWCLEVVPWNEQILPKRRQHCSAGQIAQLEWTEKHRNPTALCVTGQADGAFYLFDTAATLAEKLQIAQQYDCQLAIGIGEELTPYFPLE